MIKQKNENPHRVVSYTTYNTKMSFTKFSATCGLTIVAHGTTKVYEGDRVKQCLDDLCRGTETISAFARGVTDDPKLIRDRSRIHLDPAFIALINRLSVSIMQRFPQFPECPPVLCRTAMESLLVLDDDKSKYPSTLVEAWSLDLSDSNTVIELYNITETSEQFTFVMHILGADVHIKDPMIIITHHVNDDPTSMFTTTNVGRRSEMRMYCYHCHANVRTKSCPCRKRRYCSPECQKADWHAGHKFTHKSDK